MSLSLESEFPLVGVVGFVRVCVQFWRRIAWFVRGLRSFAVSWSCDSVLAVRRFVVCHAYRYHARSTVLYEYSQYYGCVRLRSVAQLLQTRSFELDA